MSPKETKGQGSNSVVVDCSASRIVPLLNSHQSQMPEPPKVEPNPFDRFSAVKGGSTCVVGSCYENTHWGHLAAKVSDALTFAYGLWHVSDFETTSMEACWQINRS